MNDSRACVFTGVARAAWLMQPGLILLECVVEVGLLPEINDTLAQLASGLGFGLQTIELALEETVAMPPPTVVGSDHFALLVAHSIEVLAQFLIPYSQ